jgi:hypothetical protein
MAKRFSRPKATGGNGYAHYPHAWSKIGVRINTKRVAVRALKALYGSKAARAAIRVNGFHWRGSF